MLDWLNSFTVLIQTITAVNFTYTLTHYPKRIFELIFNDASVDRIYKKDNNEISADIASLEAIDLEGILKDPNGAKKKRETLLGNYIKLREKWSELLNGLKEKINKASKVKGFKCLFLLSSLFCLFTLLSISLQNVVTAQSSLNFFLYSFFAIFNILCFAYSLYLTFIILFNVWDKFEDADCYRKTILAFVLIVFLSLVLAYFNMSRMVIDFRYSPDHIPTYFVYIFTLSVILPFYPCIIGVLYVFLKFSGFGLVWMKSLQLKFERKKLHKEKIEFDNLSKFAAKFE